MNELKNTFRPEFLNRVDDIIVFTKLSDTEIEQIATLMLTSLSKRLSDMDISISFSDEAVKHIAKIGFDPVYGARPLRRAISSKIEDAVSEEILKGNIKNGDKVECTLEDNNFIFKKI